MLDAVAAAALDVLTDNDSEKNHGMADDVLIELLRALGCKQVVGAYAALQERMPWWATA